MMVDVINLGVNVPAERFVDEAVRLDAYVIAISAMMIHTAAAEAAARFVDLPLCWMDADLSHLELVLQQAIAAKLTPS